MLRYAETKADLPANHLQSLLATCNPFSRFSIWRALTELLLFILLFFFSPGRFSAWRLLAYRRAICNLHSGMTTTVRRRVLTYLRVCLCVCVFVTHTHTLSSMNSKCTLCNLRAAPLILFTLHNFLGICINISCPFYRVGGNLPNSWCDTHSCGSSYLLSLGFALTLTVSP